MATAYVDTGFNMLQATSWGQIAILFFTHKLVFKQQRPLSALVRQE